MSGPRSVLVVEDDEQNFELVEFLLEEAGIEVRGVRDPERVEALLAESVPDMLLLDMQLPGLEGLELVARLRRHHGTARLPVVAVTAHAMQGDRERFLAGGCDGYLAKPIATARFVDQIREIWRRTTSRPETTGGP
jgi:CheY-like chemotaxis protein